MRSLFFVRRYFANIKYTKSHEWVQYFPETKLARVGISNFAQEQLGEIVHVELPAIGKKVAELESTVVIESVKIAADVYTPVAGQVTKVNEAVSKEPTLINTKPQESWLFELSVSSEPKNLLSSEEYLKTLDQH